MSSSDAAVTKSCRLNSTRTFPFWNPSRNTFAMSL